LLFRRDIAPLLTGPTGSRLSITVKRGGEAVTGSIVRASALEGASIAKAAEYAAAAAKASASYKPAAKAAAVSAPAPAAPEVRIVFLIQLAAFHFAS
jgi:hypothetical protein